jgi:hypothetical protein
LVVTPTNKNIAQKATYNLVVATILAKTTMLLETIFIAIVEDHVQTLTLTSHNLI